MEDAARIFTLMDHTHTTQKFCKVPTVDISQYKFSYNMSGVLIFTNILFFGVFSVFCHCYSKFSERHLIPRPRLSMTTGKRARLDRLRAKSGLLPITYALSQPMKTPQQTIDAGCARQSFSGQYAPLSIMVKCQNITEKTRVWGSQTVSSHNVS